jgi:hypothetical protein
MGCGCGNKNEGNFPPSVLQVNSAQCPVLFHKVVIPTNFGDEAETPVLIGERRNALVYYEVNGHTYLYSSDGVPTRLDRGGASVLYVEELPETNKAMQDTLYVSSRGELAVYKSGDKKILNEKPTYYTTLGDNTDGAMTQKAVTDALSALSEEVKNKLAEFKNGVVDRVMPEVNDKVSGMERFVTTKIEEMKRETSTLVNTTTNDVNLMNNKLNKHIEQADIAKNDLLDKIRRNTDSITDTKNSLRNYALISDVDNRVSDAEARTNNKIIQAKTEVEGKISALDTRLTKQASDDKADITQLKANLNTTNSALLTHKEQADKKFSDIGVEQDEQNNLIFDILNAFSKESEKGTNLKLNTSATKVLGMTIYGNTEQVKTSGYNIFRFGDMNNTLSQGIKSKTDENGYITSTGTATTDWVSVTSFDSNSVLMPGTYTLSIEPSAPIRTSINGELVSNNSYKWLGAVDPGQTKVTFTVTEPIKQVRLSIRTVSNQALNIKFRPMLEAGSESHSYEPYTGGATNLYDCAYGLPVTVNGLTIKQTNGTLVCTGTATNDFVRFQEKNISDILENNNAYTIYADTTTADLRLTVRLKRKDNNSYEYYNTINSQTATFTWNTAVYSEAYIYLVTGEKTFWNGSRSVASRFGLFKGDSFSSNDYAPVGMNKPTFGEIKGVNNINIFSQGKNLFDTRFGERVVNGVNIKTYSDGSFELNGTPTTGFSLMNVFNSKSYIPSEKYKLKIEHLGGSVEKVWSGAYFIYTIPIQRNTSKQPYQAVLKPEHLNNFSNEFAITVNDILEEYYVPFVWIPYHIETSEAFWNYKNLRLRITLVKDGENTDFTEFISSSLSSNLPALYKVGNYQDYIIMRDDKWYLVKNTATKTLNGTENWIKTAEPENIFICQNIINATKNYDDAYFSHFNNIKRYPNADKTGAIRGDNGTNVAFCMNNIPNITSFKNWLNQNNVTVLYPIAQPITAEITDPVLLTQLNKLMDARTYDGITNISITGTDLVPEIKVKYMRKIGE